MVTLLGVLLLGLAAAALVRQWDGLVEQLSLMSWPWVVVSVLLALVAVAAHALSWRSLLEGFGGHLPLPVAVSVYCTGQLGKYVPGSVWTVVAHAEVARSHGVERVATGSASVASMLVMLGTGVPVAAVVLPFTGAGAVSRYWWLGLVLVGCVIAVQPRVIEWALRTLARLLRREVTVARLDHSALFGSIGWMLGGWLAWGLHLYVLGLAMGGDGSALLARSIGGFALAWCVGFVVVFAPAGLGVREAALVVALGSVVSAETALAMAVVSRVVLVLADVVWGGAGLLVLFRRGRPAEQASSPGPPGLRAGRR